MHVHMYVCSESTLSYTLYSRVLNLIVGNFYIMGNLTVGLVGDNVFVVDFGACSYNIFL